MEKIKITNLSQFEKLVEELEKNPTIARGFQRGCVPNNFKIKWDEITTTLNALGPPRRAVDGWQKVWRDLKFKVKKKMVANKAECTATGGGRFKQYILSPLEEAVANLLQFEQQLNPEGAIQGIDIQTRTSEIPERIVEIPECTMDIGINDDVLFTINEPNESVTEESFHLNTSGQKENSTTLKRKATCTKSKATKCKNNRQELLQQHSKEQAKLLKDISNSLLSLKRSMRDDNKYKKELVELKRKKLKLLEEKANRDREVHESEQKLRNLKLLIKEKELALLSQNQR